MTRVTDQSPGPRTVSTEQFPVSFRILGVVGLIALLVFGLFTWKQLSRPSAFGGHYHGEMSQDIATFTAGLNFAQCGFVALKFQSAPSRLFPDGSYTDSRDDYYFHEPSSPEILSGLLQVAGINRLPVQRILPYSISVATLVLLTLGLAKIVAGSVPEATRLVWWLVPALVMSSPWFIFWAGSLWEWPYGDFLLSLGLWLLLTNRLRGFAVASLLLGFVSYEMVPLMFAMGCFKVFLEFRQGAISARKSWGYLLLFFLAPTIAFGIHLAQNAWFLGGFREAIQDYLRVGVIRVGYGSAGRYSVAAHLAKQASLPFLRVRG